MNIQEIIASIPLQAVIFCLTGIACIAIAIFAASGNKKLKETGLTADGIIYSLEQNPNQSSSEVYTSNVKDKITVRFLTKEDVWITALLKMNFLVSYTGQYKAGEQVKVIYNPNNPSEFMIETKQSERIGRILFGIAGLAFLVLGIYQYLIK